jgi:hypothetical protein
MITIMWRLLGSSTALDKLSLWAQIITRRWIAIFAADDSDPAG